MTKQTASAMIHCQYSPTSANSPCNVFYFSLCLHKNYGFALSFWAYLLQQFCQSTKRKYNGIKKLQEFIKIPKNAQHTQYS
jgi:methyl coenzyme M reductase alpha subunit